MTGRARYVDDLSFPGAWYGRTVRSSVPHGRIERITYDAAFDWSRVVVVTADDIPGDNVVQLIEDDQPVLATDCVNHREEPILLIAAPNKNLLDEAASHVVVDYTRLDATLDLSSATEPFAVINIRKGDVESVLTQAAIVVERTFRVGYQEQLYIEPQGAIALPNDKGGITVYGSLQCPFYVHRALKRALNLTDEQSIVIQTETGGGFGGKEEYPSLIAIHAALLARKARRPIRLIYDRHEDISATTKRHPGVITHRIGIGRDGALLAQDIDIVLDGGAYCTLTPVVLSRSAIHAAGSYSCPNVRIAARALKTNTPPNGAFRGFGAPQSLFAAELMVEHAAQALGVSSLDLRRTWMLRVGDTTATGQRLNESVGSDLVLEAALQAARPPRTSNDPAIRCGRGMSLVFHGSGFTGAGEKKLAGRVALELNEEGDYRILTASTEIGQGTKTIFCQIAADALGVPFDRVTMAPPDTSIVPDSGPTVASRTAMIVGGLVHQAAQELRQRAASEQPPIRVEQTYVQPKDIKWDESSYQGDAYPVYAWACNIVDVEVSVDTGEVAVTDLTTAVDLGKAIHPVMAEGQIEGGTLQAVGYATIEEIKMDDGRYLNDRLSTCLIPTALDAPRIKTVLVENPYSRGPFGAKGIGELPMDAPAPAIIAAIHDATGVWLNAIPATPEQVLEALKA